LSRLIFCCFSFSPRSLLSLSLSRYPTMMFSVLFLLALVCGAQAKLSKRAAPPGPGTGKGVVQNGDSLVFDYWVSDDSFSDYGRIFGLVCQSFRSFEKPTTLLDFYIDVSQYVGQTALDITPFLYRLKNSTSRELLWTGNRTYHVVDYETPFQFSNINQSLEASKEYLMCFSTTVDDGHSYILYLDTKTTPDRRFWNGYFSEHQESMTFFANFTIGSSSSPPSSCTACAAAGEVWCLDDSQCYSLASLPSSCRNYITSSSSCPAPHCSTLTSCASCTGTSECVWCFDRSVPGACYPLDTTAPACSANHIASPSFCPKYNPLTRF
jgi:hypothetical protein